MYKEDELIKAVSDKVIALVDSAIKSKKYEKHAILDPKYILNVSRKMIGLLYQLKAIDCDMHFSNKTNKLILQAISEEYLSDGSEILKQFKLDLNHYKSNLSESELKDFIKDWLFLKDMYHPIYSKKILNQISKTNK